ncbi:kelch repeat and BTB domain-containing protein 8-like [Physella acuta]|uniref:kelch repeat and BTB domain-containing protein 8-like n=1 Tax=Physella acuta TaxID=109671 RepID=UPI0027DC1691|nr:kelch repeat and BTB domain-containing protein 8-like [Physella acuta]
MELQATRDIPACLVKKIETLWNEKELLDFNVNIDGINIPCHRLMLAACSEFFRCLFRSSMKETHDNVVTVQGMSVETFNLILKYVYTGENILTVENVINVWRAVDQLQIDFMIDICEKFAINALDLNNLEDIYKTSKLLNAITVLDALKAFMLKHFNDFCKTKTFMELSFEEIHELIIDQDLNANDEDIVLESVFKWVEYEEGNNCICETKEMVNDSQDDCENMDLNQQTRKCLPYTDTTVEIKVESTSSEETNLIRKDKLVTLLQNVRMCLVRPALLSKFFGHKLLQGNDEAKALIFKATLHRIHKFNHGQWISAAIHRNSSNYGHYGVYTHYDDHIKLLCIESEKCHTLSSTCPLKFKTQPCIFDNKLYCFGYTSRGYSCRLVVYQDDAINQMILRLNPVILSDTKSDANSDEDYVMV